jgi:hypothetical protein
MRLHFYMMLHVVMLGVMITAVLLAGLPEDLKLALVHTVSDPIKTHVHHFGPFLFHRIISDTHGGTVVGDHRGWGLWMPEFFKCDFFGDSLLSVEEEASSFGFGGAGE